MMHANVSFRMPLKVSVLVLASFLVLAPTPAAAQQLDFDIANVVAKVTKIIAKVKDVLDFPKITEQIKTVRESVKSGIVDEIANSDLASGAQDLVGKAGGLYGSGVGAASGFAGGYINDAKDAAETVENAKNTLEEIKKKIARVQKIKNRTTDEVDPSNLQLEDSKVLWEAAQSLVKVGKSLGGILARDTPAAVLARQGIAKVATHVKDSSYLSNPQHVGRPAVVKMVRDFRSERLRNAATNGYAMAVAERSNVADIGESVKKMEEEVQGGMGALTGGATGDPSLSDAWITNARLSLMIAEDLIPLVALEASLLEIESSWGIAQDQSIIWNEEDFNTAAGGGE